MGAYKGIVMQVMDMHLDGNTPDEIARAVGITVEEVLKIKSDYS